MGDFDSFARLVAALRPWLGQLVVVGGWAHRLHRFHHLANSPNYQPLRTADTDLVFAPEEDLEGDLRAALRAAGFTEEFFGDYAPPATHYRLSEDNGGFYAEFLTPLLGSGTKRNGAPDATISKAGVTAQKLRYLELLLLAPWTVNVGADVGVPIESPLALFVPVQLISFLPAYRVLMVWLYDRTGSLLVAMLMHASLTASMLILGPLAISGGTLLTYELVFAAALWVVVAAVVVADRRHLSRQPLRKRVA